MTAGHYVFRHSAEIAAPVDEVAATLLDLEHYPDWWPQVRAVARLGPDDALVVCRSRLPYDLELHLTAVSRLPGRLEVAIDGALRGFARWQLTGTAAGATSMAFLQEVEVVTTPLRMASRLARPLLVWNHQAMMRGCVDGLSQALISA